MKKYRLYSKQCSLDLRSNNSLQTDCGLSAHVPRRLKVNLWFTDLFLEYHCYLYCGHKDKLFDFIAQKLLFIYVTFHSVEFHVKKWQDNKSTKAYPARNKFEELNRAQ